MSTYFISTTLPSSTKDLLSLYESVGWTELAADPEGLVTALNNSTFIACAWSSRGTLIGLARVLSDEATVCYLQEILVHPDYQRTGVGRALFAKVAQQFDHVPQIVAVADASPGHHAFFRALGLSSGADLAAGPKAVFTHVR